MADLNARIKPKKSSTAGEVPLAADLEVAELAVNTADGKLFVKHTDASIKEISGGGGAVDSVNGETGVVSLGIQDMDDYATNQSSGPAATAEYVFGSSPNCGNNGILRWYDFIPGEFRINTAADTGSYNLLPTSNGADLWVQVENNPVEQITITSTSFNNVNCYRSYAPVPTALTTAVNGDRVKLWTTDPSITAVPLADGDILQWVDADQKFKPAQLPAGGGGAVDSVNDETGAVSLGVQDMNDFELNPAPGVTILVYNTFSASGSYASPGSAGAYLTGQNRFIGNQYDSNGVDAIALQGEAITANGGTDSNLPVWFSADGVTWTAATSAWSNHPNDFRFNNLERVSDGSDIDLTADITASGPIYVAMSDPSTPPTPLAQGDILQWSDGDQKFKPAQLPVASVNGETGAVSLGVQEMDDFELYYDTPAASLEWVKGADASCGNNTIVETTASMVFLNLTPLVGDINNFPQFNNETFWAQVGDGPVQEIYITYMQSNDFNCRRRIMPVPVGLHEAADGTSFKAWTTEPVTTDIPLADGDILQWVDAESKFKPAQLPVASVNGETGAVSLDIQDMDDFELNPTTATKTWSEVVVGDSGHAGVADRCVLHSSGTFIYFNWSVEGVSIFDEISELNNQTVQLTLDGISITTTLSAQNNGASFSYFQSSASLSTMVTAVQGDPTLQMTVEYAGWSGADIPLADGDILQWVDVDQKFKPVQLPVASVNGETGAVELDLEDLSDVGFATQSSWASPNTGTPASNEYRLYGAGNPSYARLSTTTSTGYEKDELLARLTLGANVTFKLDGTTYTGSVSTAAVIQDGGTAVERVWVEFDVTPSLPTSTLSDGALTLIYDDLPSAPADSQVLSWSQGGSRWTAIDNPTTIQGMDDYNPGVIPYIFNPQTSSYNSTAGAWGFSSQNGGTNFYPNVELPEGQAFKAELLAMSAGDTLWLSINDGTVYPLEIYNIEDHTTYVRFWSDSPLSGTYTGNLTIYTADPTLPSATYVLGWNDSTEEFQISTPPVLTASETRTALGIGEYVDDSAAGTAGLTAGAMYYNTTSSDYRLKS